MLATQFLVRSVAHANVRGHTFKDQLRLLLLVVPQLRQEALAMLTERSKIGDAGVARLLWQATAQGTRLEGLGHGLHLRSEPARLFQKALVLTAQLTYFAGERRSGEMRHARAK